MSRVYDNWERLVGAVLKREELRRIALCDSFSSSISADFSSDSSHEHVPAGLDGEMDQAGSSNWVYDNWEKLVGAVLKREELRRIALCDSFSSSISADFSSRFSFDAALEDMPGASRISHETFDPATSSSQSNFFYRDVQPIEFEEIKKAIKEYRPLEQGGIGIVFKGWTDEHTLTASEPGSGMAVAVKWNHGSLQELPEWLKEIKYLNQLHHPNLVKPIGYCLEEDNMILVYEFMPKGSLDNHLFRRWHQLLSWATRIKIAIDAARGLSYLHDREIPIIHGDVKTANILLDGEFNAKLSNFSLSWDGPTGDMTHVSTQVVGTLGYAAPEYIATGHLTTKCDVYGFGVVLLELLSGRRVLDRNRASKEQNLVKWAKPYLGDKRKLLRIMDTRLEGQYPDEACTVAKLALRCLSTGPKDRPRMAEVVVALEQVKHDDIDLPSFTVYVNKILRYLSEDENRSIGIVGHIGVGKTTVMKTLNNQLKDTSSLLSRGTMRLKFDVVIWINYHKQQDAEGKIVEMMQDVILGRLKLNREKSNSIEENADIISRALWDKKYILLIDQVSSTIDLNEVGIHKDHKFGKVVVASTSNKVIRRMADQYVEIWPLSRDEALDLFQKVCGTIYDARIKEIADNIVKKLLTI